MLGGGRRAAAVLPRLALLILPSERKRSRSPLPWLAGIAAVLIASFVAASRNVTVEDAARVARSAADLAERSPLLVAGALDIAIAISGALSLPTKGLLNVLAGALIGPIAATAVTLAAVLAGTSLLFFAIRRLLRERVSERMGDRARGLERRLAAGPVRAIAGLRLVVILPYGPITMAAALTSIGYRRFLVGSLLGDLPVVALYSLAGERLGGLATASEAISPLTAIALGAAGALLLAGALFGNRGLRRLDEER